MTTESRPTISVLVHNLNRADCLARCLRSLATQSIRPVEVVVLDAGSTDNSPAILTEHSARLGALGIAVLTKTCAPMGVPASRNLAAQYASGDLLLFMDNDATLDNPDALEQLQGLFQREPELGLAGCRILAGDSDEEDPFCWVYRRSVSRWPAKPFATFTFAGAGFCARATAYHQAGGFWEIITYSREEEALALRLIDAGWKLAYRPEAVVRHYPDPRGRRALIERRAVELKNGVLIYWHAYPAGLGLVCSILRTASMTFRCVLRREGSIRTLLRGWTAAQALWKERGLQREPVSWATMLRVLTLHRAKERHDAPTS